MGFNIDLGSITLMDFRLLLMESNLVPSRVFLKEHSKTYFNQLVAQGLENVSQLLKALKAKGAVKTIAEQANIPEIYLGVLLREIKGYLIAPSNLDKFPGLEVDTAGKLAAIGLVNSVQLFDKVLTRASRAELASQANIQYQELLKVTKLVDLTRIRWVNPTFAYAIHEAGFDTVEKVGNANPEEMYIQVKTVNEERKFFPAHLGLVDIKRCIDFAQLVSWDINYEEN